MFFDDLVFMAFFLMIAVPFPSPFVSVERVGLPAGSSLQRAPAEDAATRCANRRAMGSDGTQRGAKKSLKSAGTVWCEPHRDLRLGVLIAERFFSGVLHAHLLGVRNQDLSFLKSTASM